MKVVHYVFTAQMLAVASLNPVAAEERTGSDLFDYYACNGCHGAEGKNPISTVVPDLTGKSADELYAKAQKILGGQEPTQESEIMHVAFYSPSQCDHPPSHEELKMITEWLASR